MSMLYERIKQRRLELGLTTDELAQKMGYKNRSSITKIEKGHADIPQSKVIAFARALDTTTAWLMGVDTSASPIPPGFEPLPDMAELPLVGAIACGTPILAEQNIEDRVGIPAEWHADFVLRCKGDSMAPVIQDGDLVAIRQQPQVENGQIAAVRIENEATLKRVFLNPSQLRLVPVNPEYEPIFLLGEEMNTAHIEGLAVGLCRGI